jgi:CheY-like chemotaxis protein
VRFDVIHSSQALDQQQRDRIFEPFAQAEMSGDDGHSGTGLSLTISRRIARLLGGDITADRDPDVGNVFSATIATGSVADVPLVTAPVNDEEDKDEATTPKSMRALSGARVLLAEDGPDNRRLVTYMLERAGVDVTVADNGQLAIDAVSAAAAGQRSFDVILMDMQMPVLDGYQATQQLRAAGLTTPIIALTAHAMSKDRDKCLQAGCDDYVAKPINRDHLLTLVENCRQAGG